VWANLVGNSFTIPALFASAAMGANAFSGIGTTPADVGQYAQTGQDLLQGGSGADTLVGSAAGDPLAPASGAIVANPTQYADAIGPVLDASASTSGGLAGTLSTLKDLAPLVGPVVSGLGAVVGGITSRNAAKDAAQTQADAARDANNTLLTMFDQSRADLAPYREAGTRALGTLSSLTDAPLTYGPYVATGPLDPTPYAFQPPSGQQVLNQDPSYSWRVSEGQKALERSAAARGMATLRWATEGLATLESGPCEYGI